MIPLRTPTRRALGRSLALAALAVGPGAPAEAGDELPFYPSYYPQEIRIETLAPQAAAPLLRRGTLHAYIGGDPFAGAGLPEDVAAAESLRSYLVVTLNPAAPGLARPEARCEALGRVAGALSPRGAAVVVHPYPVTPYHADYLEHFDLAQATRGRLAAGLRPGAAAALRIRAQGALARSLLGPGAAADGGGWDARLGEVTLDDLLGQPGGVAGGSSPGPPWVKAGWYHAWLLAVPGARQAAEPLFRRLAGGAYTDPVERVTLARELVTRLGAGCERAVLGYTVRREPWSTEFSQGIENVAWDSLAGLGSGIFIRTAKLKDFPWNGWMRLGLASRATAAWNPVAGFGDPVGRLVWAAVGDPALLPEPYGSGWVANRVRPAAVAAPAGGVEVPEDALSVEPGTGRLRPVGSGRTARARIVYRVAASAFFDNTRMTAADAVYPYLFAARWGVKRPGAGGGYDPVVDAATALGRRALVAFRVLRTEAEVTKHSDVTFTHVVPVIEVYLDAGAADPQQLAALAPPWSAVPWELGALMEEAVRRGVAAFSAGEARRRGIRWLDLARDRQVTEALARLLDELGQQNHVPEGLQGLVPADEAQTRWAALRQFYRQRGHFLVTNGPYQLERWGDGVVVLQVFRDLTNPMGVGSFDRFAIPRRGWITRLRLGPEGLEVSGEVEQVEKFLRQFRLARQPLARPGPHGHAAEAPACRYLVLGADGAVVAAGTSDELHDDRLLVRLTGRLGRGPYTGLLALTVGENHLTPEVSTVQFRVEASP